MTLIAVGSCHRQGIDLPVGERAAVEDDELSDALGLSAHGVIDVDAAVVGDKDVELAGPVV
jgi:hypothetical protein